jgi:hypothetical protein
MYPEPIFGRKEPLSLWRKRFFLFFLCLPLALSPAFAAVKKSAPKASSIAMSRARPVFDAKGAFGFCVADHKDKDRRKLTFAMSPLDEINLDITIPGGGFVKGEQYDLSLGLDRARAKDGAAKPFVRTVRAMALDDNGLLFQMGKSAPFQKALTTSRELSLGASGKTEAFALPDMNALLNALKTCNRDNLKGRDEKTAESEKAPGDEKGMPRKLRALLAAAGFKDVVPLGMDGVPEDQRPSDYLWQTGHLLGGIRERLAPKGKGLADLTGLYLEGLKKKCSGAFTATVGREVQYAGLKMHTADVKCVVTAPKGAKKGPETEAKDIAAALLFYITDAGRFTVFTQESLIAYAEEGAAARNAIKRIIVDLAADEKTKKP